MKIFLVLILLSSFTFANIARVKTPYMKVYLGNKLSQIDVNKLDRRQLRKLKNLIFARHGYKFRSSNLNEFYYLEMKNFSGFETLSLNENFDDSNLTFNDQENIELILDYSEEIL